MAVTEGTTSAPTDGAAQPTKMNALYNPATGFFYFFREDNATAHNMKVALYDSLGNPLLIADDAAFTPGTSRVVPIGALADETAPDSVDEGDIGAPRMTLNRVLRTVPSLYNSTEAAESARSVDGISATAPGTGVAAVGGGTFTLSLSSGTPVPTGSDLTTNSGGALASTDFSIRDTNNHYFAIPTAGWRRTWLRYRVNPAFDQAITFRIYLGVAAAVDNNTLALDVTLPISSAFAWSVGEGATGQGGAVGGANIASGSHYNVPALNGGAPILVRMIAGGVPTAGTFTLDVYRSRI